MKRLGVLISISALVLASCTQRPDSEEFVTVDPDTGEVVARVNQSPANRQSEKTVPGAVPSKELAPLANNDSRNSSNESTPASQLNLSTKIRSGAPAQTFVEGQFRTYCSYSHLDYADPIVLPGQPGKSHLHMFFGNTLTNAYSTASSMLDSGGSTCQGQEANRTGYWMPALFDATGKVRVPKELLVYYKTAGFKASETFDELPPGLKIVAGDATGVNQPKTNLIRWGCGAFGDETSKGRTIPDCPTNQTLTATVMFPNCWDGRLDSPDHKSHMSYSVHSNSRGFHCPSSHPRAVPQVSQMYFFDHPETTKTSQWYVSSDRTNGKKANGSTLHADLFTAWNPQIVTQWHQGCITTRRNCSPGILGGGDSFGGAYGKPSAGQQWNLSQFNRYDGPMALELPSK